MHKKTKLSLIMVGLLFGIMVISSIPGVANARTVWTWGSNNYGQLGIGTTNTYSSIPVQVSELNGLITIADCNYHTIVLKSDGTVWTWGRNDYGQLGDGTDINRNVPVQVNGLSEIIAIAGSSSHTIALKNDGTVWTWGYNASGQLGDGTTTDRHTPVQVSGLSGVTAIAGALGGGHTIALKNDGTVWAWGYNGFGQLGDGTTTDKYTPVQVSGLTGVKVIALGSHHSIALKSDGTVWAWGYNASGQLGDGTTTNKTTPVQVSGLTGVSAIAGGMAHTIALKSDGTVWTWGYNGSGQLGDGTRTERHTPVQVNGLSGIIDVAGGYDYTTALKNDGTVWIWGYDVRTFSTENYTPVQVSELSGITAIAGGAYHTIALKNDAGCTTAIDAGWFHSIALKADGTVWTWGPDGRGELGETAAGYIPLRVSGLTGVSDIDGGTEHTIALKSDGTVWAWGKNDHGQLGDGTTTNRYTPVQVSGLTGISTIAAGGDHSVALKADGTVWAWGRNHLGQLGDGTTTDRYTPVQVSGLTGVSAVGAGGYCTVALKSDGTVWAWGYNAYGQLGDGTTTNRYTPVQVSGLTNVSAIDLSHGAVHVIALKADGTVWTWGYNASGMLGDGTTINRTTPVQVSGLTGISSVAVGDSHTVAMKSDGTVWTWGWNGYGGLGDGTTTDRHTPVQVSSITGISAIAAGRYYSIALKTDGTVWTWGLNYYASLGDCTHTDRYTPVQVKSSFGEPSPPASLYATGGNAIVNLDWADNSGCDIAGYNIYRNLVSGGPYTKINSTTQVGSQYQDTGLTNGATYYYVVKAVDIQGNEGTVSSEVSATPQDNVPPSSPTGLTASSGNGTVGLNWNDNSESDLSGYNIYRSTTSGSGYNKINTTTVTVSQYTDSGLTNGTAYYYVVTAIDTSSLESSHSSQVSATPMSNPPTASASATPTSGTAPLTVSFTGTGTDDGSVTKYEWDFDGNGTYDWSSTTGGNTVKTYSSAGTYTATLRVTDNDNLTGTASLTITVSSPPSEKRSPTASLSATPTSGTAPLTVTFTYSGTDTDGTIQKHEVDFDGNGTYDFVSTSSGSVSYTYGQAGNYTATLKVTDNDGLSGTATVTISVDEPTGTNPLVADANCNPSSVTVGETVTLTGSAIGGSGTYIVYIWDYEGDGEYDWASTTTGTTFHTYDTVGSYSPTVMVIDSGGLTDTDSDSLTVSSPSTLKVWISQPKNGNSVWGSKMTLHANTAPGNLTKSVQLQYKGITSDWTDIGSEMFPTPNSFFAVTWDVTGLTEGDYQLRAVGKDTSDNTVNSKTITVTVTQTNPDIEDGEDENSNREKKQKISKDETTESSMDDNTSVEIPYGTLTEDATLTVTALTTNPKDTTEGANSSLDKFRQIELEGNPTLKKSVTVTIPYDDTDNDGIVDGTNIPEKDLKLWWYNTTTGKWEKIADTEVDTTNKKVKVKVGHLSNFAIGSEDTAAPSAPSGLSVTAGDGQVSLTWTNPTDADFAGVKVIRKTSGYPASVTDGTEVYSGTGTGATDTGRTNGEAYYYTVFAYDEVPNYSTGAQATATPQAAGGGSGGGGGGGGCFIATAAYGTPMADEVVTLCGFRDAHLLTNPAGKRLVSFYYKVSPPIAEFIAKHESLKSMVRFILKPVVKLVE